MSFAYSAAEQFRIAYNRNNNYFNRKMDTERKTLKQEWVFVLVCASKKTEHTS